MNHIVDTCSLTKFEGGLNLLHEADEDMAGIYSDCGTREMNCCATLTPLAAIPKTDTQAVTCLCGLKVGLTNV